MRFQLRTLFLITAAVSVLMFLVVIECRHVREVDLGSDVPVRIEGPLTADVTITYTCSEVLSPWITFPPLKEGEDPFALPFPTIASGDSVLPHQSKKITVPRKGYRSYFLGRNLGDEPECDYIKVVVESNHGNGKSGRSYQRKEWESDGEIVIDVSHDLELEIDP